MPEIREDLSFELQLEVSGLTILQAAASAARKATNPDIADAGLAGMAKHPCRHQAGFCQAV